MKCLHAVFTGAKVFDISFPDLSQSIKKYTLTLDSNHLSVCIQCYSGPKPTFTCYFFTSIYLIIRCCIHFTSIDLLLSSQLLKAVADDACHYFFFFFM